MSPINLADTTRHSYQQANHNHKTNLHNNLSSFSIIHAQHFNAELNLGNRWKK